MKILVFEYITGGGLAHQALPVSLAREGDLMLMALLNELAGRPDLEVCALRDWRLCSVPVSAAALKWVTPHPDQDIWDQLASEICRVDAVWPIAPETDGVLERLCMMVEQAGKCLLNSPASAVRSAASKRQTLELLEACGIRGVPFAPLEGASEPPPFPFPLVAKPDDGAGCEGSRIMDGPQDWRAFLADSKEGAWLVQPWVEGSPISLSALFSQGKARLLTVNRQRVERQGGRFVLKGCRVNAIPDTQGVLTRLAGRVAAALPDLWGYAGIDLIQNDQGYQVLEINPRLTTSYAGIREAIGINVAECVLNLAETGRLPNFRTFSGQSVETLWQVD